MQRLAEHDLIHGRLLEISEPHLVERYNRALKAFGLPATQLELLRIDMTGYSPEVAEELGDPLYLDPNAVNRRFIILSPAQEGLPVVHTAFSNTASLMHGFFDANRRAIHAVTIRDVLYGEIEEDIVEVQDVEDLLSIQEVRFNVLAADDMLGKAEELRELSDRLLSVPEAWRDDAMIERMVELAQQTGDIRKNTLVPDKVIFRHEAFWSGHFGGIFVFLDGRNTTVICDPNAPGFRRSRPWQVGYIALDDHARIFEFLQRTGRIELPRASWIDKSGYLSHRTDMVLHDLIRRNDAEARFDRIDAIWLQTWIHRHAGAVAEDGVYPFLQAASRRIAADGEFPLDEADATHRFLLVRARADHADRWLVNRLISVLVPADFVSRFVFDKQGFYSAYESYSDGYKDHVVKTLSDTYLRNKRAFRARLYGLEEDRSDV
ncbi:DUF6638 family protein [Hoeflea prorocentri]|uniref:Uncharacterized protein n=1 Tax=Hoeflea prorocentri TaxID=1922333 RepID=A0A9X3UF10_9HYPH|nr:DUF6638 family protein [Hoeflea prorocentri]MCY6379511.1 hypothetical protein [Hoeflea prorocentri]MDA5397311.1 hypothetical protein [Hoeflea prorocentri]